MKEHSIIMSGNHPQLILDGIKTQTRRVIKPQFTLPTTAGKPYLDGTGYLSVIKDRINFSGWYYITVGATNHKVKCPYGQVGDRLWVRETWGLHFAWDNTKPSDIPPSKLQASRYKTDSIDTSDVRKWRPSIFMPRWASRITLEITEVRVERVQEISVTDIAMEGHKSFVYPDGRQEMGSAEYLRWFMDLWDSLNAKRGYGWEVNPWVWCLSFRRL